MLVFPRRPRTGRSIVALEDAALPLSKRHVKIFKADEVRNASKKETKRQVLRRSLTQQ